MSNKWELYDRLIAGIPGDLPVEDYMNGCAWTMVKTRVGCGVAYTVHQQTACPDDSRPIIGAPLREVAQLVKSWNFMEASIGMAAINSWYNTPERMKALGVHTEAEARKKGDAFTVFAPAVQGKKVAVIGHFPNLETQLKPICQLSILEREPLMGDYPDSACEFILEEQDFVFITGMTLINKTLPRLLELVRPDAQLCMVGPSVPLSDVLFSYGVDHLSGFFVDEPAMAMNIVRQGIHPKIFRSGHMILYSAPGADKP